MHITWKICMLIGTNVMALNWKQILYTLTHLFCFSVSLSLTCIFYVSHSILTFSGQYTHTLTYLHKFAINACVHKEPEIHSLIPTCSNERIMCQWNIVSPCSFNTFIHCVLYIYAESFIYIGAVNENIKKMVTIHRWVASGKKVLCTFFWCHV